MVMASITISIIFSEPSSFLADRNIQLPQWNLSLPNLPELNFSTGLLAALLAVFILVATDSILRKRKYVW
jgi:hypothetical protein